MPLTTADLFRSIKSQQFATARNQFSELIQDKMKAALSREYRETAKTFLQPVPKK